MDEKKRKKLPWLAAILNIGLPGLGYIYVGVKSWFATLLVLANIIIIYVYISRDYMMSSTATSQDELLMLIAGTLIMIAFGIDAHSDAKAYNEEIE